MNSDFKDVKVGQMAELTIRKGDVVAWEYLIVIHVYDDRIVFLKEYGGRFMNVLDASENESKIIDNQKDETLVTLLFKNGKPVFSKKNIFGKYTFEPKN